MDILGFKNKVKDDVDEALSINLNMKCIADEKKENINTYMFSDCMYIVGEDIEQVIRVVAIVQVTLFCRFNKAKKTINLVRGAITSGKVIDDPKTNIVIGEGVIDAYGLEQSAKFPRVVISDKLTGKIKENYIKKDSDGKSYLDFITYFKNHNPQRVSDSAIEDAISYTREYLETEKSMLESVVDKYEWGKNIWIHFKKNKFYLLPVKLLVNAFHIKIVVL